MAGLTNPPNRSLNRARDEAKSRQAIELSHAMHKVLIAAVYAIPIVALILGAIIGIHLLDPLWYPTADWKALISIETTLVTSIASFGIGRMKTLLEM